MKTVAVFGYKENVSNYERFFSMLPAKVFPTLKLSDLELCDALILPGGGDITPSFFGEEINGSRNIDTELDICQLQAMEYALKHTLPTFGICKGMQVINVALGGTILQDMPGDQIHPYTGKDSHHNTVIKEDSCLFALYGRNTVVNSAHHQRINRLGHGLQIIQWCSEDNCPEAFIHESLPILGVQWHPERLSASYNPLTGTPLLKLFASWL